MAVAIPFIGAGLGSLIGGGFGAQVGWMVGSMIYSAMQPAQVIKAGDPSTAPSVGSDIRGQNIPAIFGTVRCSGYLIWQANFKANKSTRKVGSGKKKSKQEFYEYTWDFIFHMGMVTRPYRIIGMWEGSERIQDQSMAPIVFANGDIFRPAVQVEQQENMLFSVGMSFWSFAIGSIRSLQSAQAAKKAAWAEAYWYGGHDASDPEDGWDYFQAQASAPNVRWPSTLWLGFKTLELGEQPRIPQYNFEVTPDVAAIQETYYNSTVISQREAASSSLINDYPIGVSAGGRYAVFSRFLANNAARRGFRIMDTFTGAWVTDYDEDQFGADFPQYNDGRVDGDDFCNAILISGTNDIALIFGGNHPANAYANQQHTTVCYYTIDEATGSVTPLGATSWDYGLPGRWPSSEIHCGGLDANRRRFLFAYDIAGAGGEAIASAPYPRGDDSTVGTQTVVSATLGSNLFNSTSTDDTGIASNSGFAGFVVPDNLDGDHVRFYFYVNKARIDNNNGGNSVISTYGPTYPNGFMFYVTVDKADGSIVTGVTICHSDFDQNGPPFDNADENIDGSTSTNPNIGYKERFYVGPTNISDEQTNILVIFERDLSDIVNSPDRGMAHSVRLFQYMRMSGTFEQVGSEETQQLEDVSLTYRLSTADRFDHIRGNQLVAYAPITGELLRIGTLEDSGDFWAYVARVGRARVGIVDMTPPEIIREIFTDPVIGFGKPVSMIDTDTYNAAHQYCVENGILVSGIFASSMPRIQIFENLVNVYGGWVSWNGYILKFGKPTEEFVAVATIDNSCFVQENARDPKPPINGRRQALQDTTNKVTVKYYDRSLSYRQNEVTLGDEVDQDLNGVRHKSLDTGLIMSKDTAYRLAERMLWGNMYARNVYSDVLVGWKSAHLEPGDAVRLYDEFGSTDANCRIVRREEVGRGKIKLTLVEELDYLGKSRVLYEPPRPRVRGLPTTTERPLDFSAYEVPFELQPEGSRYYVGYAPGGPTAGAGLYVSPSTTDFALQQSVVPYPDGGRVLTQLPASDLTMTDVLVVLNAKSGSNVSSIDTWFEGEIPDYSSYDRAINQSLFRVGSEMLSYEGATLVGCNTYRLHTVFRAQGGTTAMSHGQGDVWWAHLPQDGGGIFTVPYASDAIGTEFFYKVVPVGFDGVEYDPTSVPYKRYQITGEYFTPRAIDATDVRILVGSPEPTLPVSLANMYGNLAGTNLMLISPHYTRRVGSSEERNFSVQWPETSKVSGYGAQGYGTQGYGAFATDVEPVTWRVNIVGSGGAVVRSLDVSTPFYSYDALMNVADNGAWRGNVAVVIHPRNVYGFAPLSAVVSLNLSS